jgi:hypothetical protein
MRREPLEDQTFSETVSDDSCREQAIAARQRI